MTHLSKGETMFQLFLEELQKSPERIIQNDEDIIEKQIIKLIDFEIRKKKGQIPTPADIAHLMALLSLNSKNIASILDPAIGSGILIRKILEQLPKDNTPKEVEVVGFDIDPLMLDAAEINLHTISKKIKLQQKDFLSVKIDKKFDLVIANPPYIKSNQIREKSIQYSRIENQFHLTLNGTTGMDTLFLLHSIIFLNQGGRLVFLTPSDFLNSSYGVKIKKILLEHLTLEYLIYFETPDFIFDDGMASGLITIGTKETSIANEVKLIQIKNWSDANSLFTELKRNAIKEPNTIKRIKQEELKPSTKWIPLFDTQISYPSETSNFVPISTFFNVKRGIATGANEFFTLTEQEKAQWKIDDKYLKKVITKAPYAKPPVFNESHYIKLLETGKKAYLLDIQDEDPTDDKINEYLSFGKTKNFHTRYLTKHRQKWFFMEKRQPAAILVKVFNRNNFQFILNETNCLNLTCFHALYPKTKDNYSEATICFLQTKFGLDSIRLQLRHYGGGLKKLEPSDVEQILIPDFSLFSQEDLNSILHIFELWKREITTSSDLKSRFEVLFKHLTSKYASERPL